jgi:hypothetical protein
VIEYLKLENVADERGEEPAKVARTLVRLGCNLYLHFGPSRDSRSGVSFYPEHPTERMEHNIGSGDKQLTKDSQEAVIKRLGRGDTTTEGLTVLDVSPNEVSQKLVLSCDEIVELDPKQEILKFQIELMEQDDSVCVVVHPDDVSNLPPPSQIGDGVSETAGGASTNNKFNIFQKNKIYKKKTNPEIHKIFWRTYIFLREEFDHAPKYKEIWQAIYDDVENSDMEDSLAVRREFDPNEIIEKIDSIGMPKTTKLFWIDATAGGEISSQGNYSLSSLPSLINKLKKDPLKI